MLMAEYPHYRMDYNSCLGFKSTDKPQQLQISRLYTSVQITKLDIIIYIFGLF